MHGSNMVVLAFTIEFCINFYPILRTGKYPPPQKKQIRISFGEMFQKIFSLFAWGVKGQIIVRGSLMDFSRPIPRPENDFPTDRLSKYSTV